MQQPAPPLNWTLNQILECVDAYIDTLEMIESDEERTQAEGELSVYLEALARKVDSTVEFLDFLEARRELRKAQVIRLEKANKRDAAIVERIESSIQRVIESGSRDRIEGSLYTFRLRKCPPSVDVLDMEAVPEEYRRYKVEIQADKTAAKAAMKAGEIIPGLALVLDRKSVVRA
jgi:hypothetical protein